MAINIALTQGALKDSSSDLAFRRARMLHWISLAVGVVILILAAAGCQTTGSQVSSLPPPSFDGPQIIPSAPPPLAAPISPRRETIAGIPGDWYPRVSPRPWRWIVIHHSASPSGSMAVFDKEHKAKGWDGVGYDFVIGNGTDSGDGQVEVTPRWPIQKWGAHAKTPDNRYNEYGIGICMVGNFDITRPTPRQLASLTKLVAFLMERYQITPANVIGHRDTKATDCPGRYVDLDAIRRRAEEAIVRSGGQIPGDRTQTAASSDLLVPIAR